MNISNSECSSGCESGWTVYWDQLSNSTDQYNRDFVPEYEGKSSHYLNQDEDLSMVSDASSGPPHLHENYAVGTQHYGYASHEVISEEIRKKSKQKNKTAETSKKKQHNFCLDDTASSPVFHFSQDNVAPPNQNHIVPGFSHVFSVQGEATPKKHLGFFKSSTKGKSGSLHGRKRQ